MCHAALNQSVVESTDPGASNGGSNFEIRPLEADLVSFEVATLPENVVRTRNWAKMRTKTENSKLSETIGKSSGQVRNGSRTF